MFRITSIKRNPMIKEGSNQLKQTRFKQLKQINCKQKYGKKLLRVKLGVIRLTIEK